MAGDEAITGVTTQSASPGIADPRGYVRALAEAESAEVVTEAGAAGGPTLRAVRTPPPELAEVAAEAGVTLPDGIVEIDLDREGRPAAIRLTVEGESASQRDDVRVADWGGASRSASPRARSISTMPWLDEEAMAFAREGITPVWPTALPEGVVLQDVYAVGPDEAAEWDQPCGELDLMYGPPLDEVGELGDGEAAWAGDMPVLDIVLLPRDCALAMDATPFDPGAYGDLPVREVDGVIDVLIGDTVASVDRYQAGDDLAGSSRRSSRSTSTPSWRGCPPRPRRRGSRCGGRCPADPSGRNARGAQRLRRPATGSTQHAPRSVRRARGAGAPGHRVSGRRRPGSCGCRRSCGSR